MNEDDKDVTSVKMIFCLS